MKTEHIVTALVGMVVFVGVTSGVYITLVGAEDAPRIHVVASTIENLENYNDSVLSIYSKYQELVDAEVRAGNSAQTLSSLYHRAALELMALPVPESLLDTHTELVDTYLSSERSLEAAGN